MALNRQRLDAVAKLRPAECVKRAKERKENREWIKKQMILLAPIRLKK